MRSRLTAVATAIMLGMGGAAMAQSSDRTVGSNTGSMPPPDTTGATTHPAPGSPVAETPQGHDPANPPGTAAVRSLDRNLGTNMSGAYPTNDAPKPPASPTR